MESPDQEATMMNSDEQEVTGSSQTCIDKSEVEIRNGLAVVQMAVDLMNSNQYIKAIQFLKPKADVCMYHSMAYGTVLFLQAVFCMERDAIDKATEVLEKTIELCNSSRRPRGMIESLSSWVFGQRLDEHTPSELQAEVFYAEANLLMSFLTFLQDESLMSFVKGGLRMRSCFTIYKQLHQWMASCRETGVEVEENFAAGVRMGYGCFNLFLSLLPTRIMKLLEFIGFSVNRKVGLEELSLGACSASFRAPLCTSFLLSYYTVAAVFTGIQIDAERAEELLHPQLTRYPNSVQLLYFQGRVNMMKGAIDEALVAFKAAMNAQEEWKQVRHLCWWELTWCHCFKSEWAEAARYSDNLCTESRWSKAFFLYMKACFLLMDRATAGRTAPPSAGDELSEMMKKIPSLKQRIAGKSVPIEKFAVAKSERYLNGDRLPLCGMELLYSHNAFPLLQKNQELLRNLLKQTWEELVALEELKGSYPSYEDDWCVITFIQGCIFRALQSNKEAEKCFLDVLDRGEKLKHDTYLLPAANAELGLLYITTGAISHAEKRLETARNNFKGYQLETRIHFRIHEGHNKILQLKGSQ